MPASTKKITGPGLPNSVMLFNSNAVWENLCTNMGVHAFSEVTINELKL